MSPPNGSTRPVARVGGHDIEVAVHDEGRLGRVAPGDPRDDARAARDPTSNSCGFSPSALELRLDVLGGLGLAVRPALAVVRGVEPDQIAGDDRGLVEARARRFAGVASWHQRYRCDRRATPGCVE